MPETEDSLKMSNLVGKSIVLKGRVIDSIRSTRGHFVELTILVPNSEYQKYDVVAFRQGLERGFGIKVDTYVVIGGEGCDAQSVVEIPPRRGKLY